MVMEGGQSNLRNGTPETLQPVGPRYASVFGRSLQRPKGSGDEASIAARLRTILNGKGKKFSGQFRTDAFILVLEEYVGMIPWLR